ncbi:hypothetical protein BHAP_0561 [Bifidobacterium hapali]|uniref:Uncharacterized protein n=1 Tax=Bifidobacterium hapali TaxID=1630172 RepID=A0A261G350_9BIFI|nr:hypothetical protein BHAP_0561 [Bifidobacterium hapali]
MSVADKQTGHLSTDKTYQYNDVISGADGKVSFGGLSAGTYTVTETAVADGYLTNVKPTFTVTIADDGTVTFGSDTWNLVDNTTKTVKNVKSITQLPLTGAAGTALFTVLGILLAGAAVTVYTKSRSTNRALRA